MASQDVNIDQIRQQIGGQSGGPNEAAQQKAEEERRSILHQIMTTEARERLSRINLVKPENARRIEDMMLMAFRAGRLPGRVDENQLISFLGQVKGSQPQSRIVFKRRANDWDDESDSDA